MSVNYGGPPAGEATYGGGGYAPPGRVNFGWIGQAFELFKANPGVWIVATLMAFVPTLIGAIIGAVFGVSAAQHTTYGQPPYGSTPPPSGSSPFGGQQNPLTGGLPPGLSLAIQAFSLLYSAWLYGGIYRTAVKQVRGEAIGVEDVFSGAPLLWKMLGYNIVYGLAVGTGFVLCIVPGFLLAGLLFPGFALIADGETLGNAITRSIAAMKQDMWNAGAFAFVISLVAVAGVFACFVGLFVTLPLFFLSGALAYRDMVGMPGLSGGGGGYGSPTGYGAAQPGVWPPPPDARPPAFGQPPASEQSPLNTPRQSLSGDEMDDNGRPPSNPAA